MSKDIQVVIINDPERHDCDVSCGTDWSSGESLELAQKQVRNRFGDNVQLTYFDINKKYNDISLFEWKEKIKDENLMVPLLVLNGRLRITGNFDIRQMLDMIEVELELRV